jgi:hypothetical protein
VTDANRSIDGRAWGAYVSDGRAHFDRVQRSWDVFRRNAGELVALLQSVETNPVASLRLMSDVHSTDPEVRALHQKFWPQLDQRLHNMVSAAITLVDHTRPLIAFYDTAEEFTTEYAARSSTVAQSPRASFLRKLRNYLLHYGVAQPAQTLRLDAVSANEWDHLEIKLSAPSLLKWSGWNADHRAFISSFEAGPPLRRLTEQYFEDMVSLYQWLFAQYSVLHPPGVPPPHVFV